MNGYWVARFIYNTLLFSGYYRFAHLGAVTIYKHDGCAMLVSVE